MVCRIWQASSLAFFGIYLPEDEIYTWALVCLCFSSYTPNIARSHFPAVSWLFGMWLMFVRVVLPRPVKVIRLVTRSTVEEIVLSRAHDKLNLTRAVIEGGQFSGKAALSHVIDSPSKVRSALVESNTKNAFPRMIMPIQLYRKWPTYSIHYFIFLRFTLIYPFINILFYFI